jgi:hypothetical protein
MNSPHYVLQPMAASTPGFYQSTSQTGPAAIGLREFFAAIFCVLALVCINAYICRELFRNPTAFMNSMHGFWVALARSGGHSWFQPSWWPYWDCGMPFEFTYAPLIPAATRTWAAFSGMPHALALQSITGLVYCLIPVTLFVVCWRLTRAPAYALVAALVYSLAAPTQLLAPDADFSWKHFWDARRFFVLAVWDDTPHLAALALLPLVVLFLAASYRRRRMRYYIPTVILIALMAAASEFGPIEVAMAAICLLFALRADWRRNIAITAGIGAAAYALAAPFLSPSRLWAIIGASGDGRDHGFAIGSLPALAIAAIGWVLLWQYLPRWIKDWRLQFFAYFAYLASSVPLLAAYLNRQFLPQPVRYKMEMELALAPLLVFGLRPWFERARRPLQMALVFLLLALAAEQIPSHRHFAKAIMRPADATQTIEYRASVWAEQNLPGTRVMLPGSIARWANAFTDVMQFSGSSWSAAPNPVQQRAVDAVYNGGDTPEEDARVSLLWMQAYGVGAIAVSGPRSQEYWKPYAHPVKFEGVLPVLWRADDVTIYRVPLHTESLAHVVPRGAIVGRAPATASDTAEIQKYVRALDDPGLPAAEAQWDGSNRLIVRTTANQGQAISLQVSWHPGWHARVGSRAIPLKKDGLGLLWLDPRCQGPCDVQLNYIGGWELRLGHYLSFSAIVSLVLASLVAARKKLVRRLSEHSLAQN